MEQCFNAINRIRSTCDGVVVFISTGRCTPHAVGVLKRAAQHLTEQSLENSQHHERVAIIMPTQSDCLSIEQALCPKYNTRTTYYALNTLESISKRMFLVFSHIAIVLDMAYYTSTGVRLMKWASEHHRRVTFLLYNNSVPTLEQDHAYLDQLGNDEWLNNELLFEINSCDLHHDGGATGFIAPTIPSTTTTAPTMHKDKLMTLTPSTRLWTHHHPQHVRSTAIGRVATTIMIPSFRMIALYQTADYRGTSIGWIDEFPYGDGIIVPYKESTILASGSPSSVNTPYNLHIAQIVENYGRVISMAS